MDVGSIECIFLHYFGVWFLRVHIQKRIRAVFVKPSSPIIYGFHEKAMNSIIKNV